MDAKDPKRAAPAAFALSGRAELGFVEEALQRLDGLSQSIAVCIDASDQAAFALALSEILTNIVQHGPMVGVSSAVTIDLRVGISADPRSLWAIIHDTAPHAVIDWDAVVMPDALAESGRGLALAHSVLDEFTHTSDRRGNSWFLGRRLR